MRTWNKCGRVCSGGSLPDLPSSGLTRPPEVQRLKTARKNWPKYGLYAIRFISGPIRRATRSNYGRMYVAPAGRIYCPRDLIAALYGEIERTRVSAVGVQYEFIVC